jgi:uncharacterized protein YggU (UPF0235/DUF167 family)
MRITLTCYQQPTNDALHAVMAEERKVRDVAVVSGRDSREKRVNKRVEQNLSVWSGGGSNP